MHEFLRKPFTIKDLLRRLEAVTLRQRDWVEAVGYVGPDRRRFNSGDYSGALKRRSDAQATPDSERMAQALKILRSAIAAVGQRSGTGDALDAGPGRRPAQVRHERRRPEADHGGDRLRPLPRRDRGARALPYNAGQLEAKAAPLLAYMPKDDEAEAFAA